MEKASENLEFEKAAALLQTIRQIEHVDQHPPSRQSSGDQRQRRIGLFRQSDEVILDRSSSSAKANSSAPNTTPSPMSLKKTKN